MGMKRGKRVLAVALMCSLLASNLVACGGKEETKATTAKETNVTKQDNKATEKQAPVEVQIVVDVQPNADAPVVKYVEDKYNVKLNFDWVVDKKKFNEVMGVKLSSGDMPDFVNLPDSGDIYKYIKQGVAAPITDEMKAKIPTYFDVVEKYDTENNMWVDAMYKGQLYGLKPISSQGAYPTVLVWRTDWLKSLGIDGIPKTLEEFETAMYKMVGADKNRYGMSETTFNAVFGAYGAVPMKTFSGKGRQVLFMTKKEGQIEFACVQPEMKDALAKLQQYYKDGIIDPEFITGENKGGYWATSHAFINGRVGVTGMVLPNHWNPPLNEHKKKGGAVYEEMIAANPDAKFGETFDLGGALTGPEGKAGTHKWGVLNSNLAIFTQKCVKDERKTNAILQLIEDNFSDYNQYMTITTGIEGTHYTITEDGRIEPNIEKYPKTVDKKKEGIFSFELLQQPDFRQQKNPDYYDFIKKYEGPGYADERYPKTPAYTKNISSLQRLTIETYMQIITGEKSVDEFDKFVEAFNANGGAQIVKEINETIKENLGQ